MRTKFETCIMAERYKKYCLILFFSIISFLILSVFMQSFLSLTPLVSLSILLAIFINRYKRYKSGFEGELKVANYLKGLGKAYSVFHDVKLPNRFGNIDHIVLGKNGLFVIETKNNKGILKCYKDLWTYEENNKRIRSPSQQVRRSVVSLKEFLGKRGERFWVEGIAVFTNENVELLIEKSPELVKILKLPELLNWVRDAKRSPNLTTRDINEIKEKLEKTDFVAGVFV